MTSLKNTLKSDLTAAMKAGDDMLKSTLRMTIAAVMNAEVAGNEAVELSDDQVLKILQAETKKPNIRRIIPASHKNYNLEGPKTRIHELKFAFEIFIQFIKGFRTLHFVGPCITVFGSARYKEDHPYYIQAREMGKKIAALGLQDSIELISGDSEQLAFNDNHFDGITVAFGVRNFEHLETGLQEMFRVLQPGGKLVILEFSKPKQFLFKGFYNIYMNLVAPGFGKMIAKNKEAYQYLNDSVQAFPEGDAFTNIMEKVGYTSITSKKLTFGICTIYCGKK